MIDELKQLLAAGDALITIWRLGERLAFLSGFPGETYKFTTPKREWFAKAWQVVSEMDPLFEVEYMSLVKYDFNEANCSDFNKSWRILRPKIEAEIAKLARNDFEEFDPKSLTQSEVTSAWKASKKMPWIEVARKIRPECQWNQENYRKFEMAVRRRIKKQAILE